MAVGAVERSKPAISGQGLCGAARHWDLLRCFEVVILAGISKMDGSPGGLVVGASPEPVSASCPSPAKQRAKQLAQLSSCATSIAHTVEMANLFYCSLVSS